MTVATSVLAVLNSQTVGGDVLAPRAGTIYAAGLLGQSSALIKELNVGADQITSGQLADGLTTDALNLRFTL